MNEPLTPLDPELKALLDAERGATPATASLERVWSRLAVLPPGGGAGGGSGAPHAPSWLASHAVGIATATFVVGAIVGAGAHAALQKPPPERIVYVDRPAPLAVSSSPSFVAPSPEVATASPSVSAAPLAHASVRPAPSGSSTSSLSEERALLDRVRGELAENDPANALKLVDEHTRRFPRAQLAEEREVLAVQALVALGRYDEARARAAKLRAAAPNSLFLPAIDATLGSIP